MIVLGLLMLLLLLVLLASAVSHQRLALACGAPRAFAALSFCTVHEVVQPRRLRQAHTFCLQHTANDACALQGCAAYLRPLSLDIWR